MSGRDSGVKRAYAVIVADMPEIDKNNYGKEFALQMAVKAVNDTAGPDGLVPTVLVFGAFNSIHQVHQPSLSVQQQLRKRWKRSPKSGPHEQYRTHSINATAPTPLGYTSCPSVPRS